MARTTVGFLCIALLLARVELSSGSKKRLDISKFDRTHIPWYNPTLSQLSYEGSVHYNDLRKLLAIQEASNWVTVFSFNQGVIRWTLNCIYSYIKFGKARNYIVAATDEASLQTCIQYRLPCYNASFVFGAHGKTLSDKIMPINTQEYFTMVWGKILILQQVLQYGYHVHFSDVDVVYLRPVWPSYRGLFNKYRVDSVFMKETVMDMKLDMSEEGKEKRRQEALIEFDRDALIERLKRPEEIPNAPSNLFNTGVYAMRSSNATLELVAKWIRANDWKAHDQAVLNSLAFKEYVVCTSLATCQAARQAGWVTVFRHPSQFGVMGVCPSKFDVPCDPIRLFVHAICRNGWDDSELAKGRVLQKYKLWLIDTDSRPLYNEDIEDGAHPFLPCLGPAWGAA